MSKADASTKKSESRRAKDASAREGRVSRSSAKAEAAKAKTKSKGKGAGAAAGEEAEAVQPDRPRRAATPAQQSRLFTRKRIPLFILIVLVAAVVMLYGPAQQLYTAWRTGTTLESAYEEVSSDNDALNDEIDRLQTQEGIEDEARQNGYAYEGETSVIVKGVEDEDDSEDVEEEDPWYLQLGDFIFQYEG